MIIIIYHECLVRWYQNDEIYEAKIDNCSTHLSDRNSVIMLIWILISIIIQYSKRIAFICNDIAIMIYNQIMK